MKRNLGATACLAITIGVFAIPSIGGFREDPVNTQATDDCRKGDISAPESGLVPRKVGLGACSGIEAAPGEVTDGEAYIPAPVELPEDVQIEGHFAYAEGGAVGTAAETSGSFLVYSNTRSKYVTGPAGPAATAKVADDITTTVFAGCPLDKYVVRVTGDRNNTGSAPAFTVTTGLYPLCPGAMPGETPIEGTQCTFSDLPGSDVKELTCQVGESVNVPLPDNFYVGVQFSRDNCGVVLGAPPELGFSADRFDWPGLYCWAYFGGYPGEVGRETPHASFWLQVYTKEDCPTSFVGYKNSNHAGDAYTPGPNIYFADDIELGVPECNLIAYEVTIKGTSIFRFDLRTTLSNSDPQTGGVIPGTGRAHLSLSAARQVLRFPVDPPIPLPQRFYITFKTSGSYALGPILTDFQASLGLTEDPFYVYQDAKWFSVIKPYHDTTFAAFDVTIMCAGGPPVGACCDTINRDEAGEAVCREGLAEMNCPFTRWMAGETCEPDPFTPACGLSVCCTPDETCEDMTRNECEALAPEGDSILWLRDQFCDDWTVVCPFYACVQREGDCAVAHPNPGCANPFCCTPVCEIDPWCCRETWDRECVRLAQEVCQTVLQNDYCFPHDSWRAGPVGVKANSTTFIANRYATDDESDPGFSCHRVEPGARGFHTVWFTFEATRTSARVHTCNSGSPVDDSLVAVYRAGDPSTLETACDTLIEIGCNDDRPGCGTGYTSDVCVTGLVPGETYYIQLASRDEDGGGFHEVSIESPCPHGSRPDCPPGDITWIAPPNGVIDARWYPAQWSSTEGLQVFRLRAPEGAEDPACWSLCETPYRYGTWYGYTPNDIVGVMQDWDGTLVITLARPVAPGSLGAITYTDNNGTRTLGAFTVHPANVNGDEVSGPADILFLIDVLNGMRTAPWGPYSTDCDRSGGTNPSDILCVIDQLRAGEEWWDVGSNGTRLPRYEDGCHRYCGFEGGQGEPWLPCQASAFCKYPQGQCAADPYAGECVATPNLCPADYAEVCGCDGLTYSNECYADAAGVSVRHSGECEP